MDSSLNTIIDTLSGIESTIQQQKESLLANLAMAGEIPAPTFQEKERITFLINRFKEAGISKISMDEADNGIGVIEGQESKENILLVAHADTVFSKNVDHTVTINSRQVCGPGVADNTLGLAVLATLPHFLEVLDIRLNNNLILLGSTRSLGRGDLEGVQFFLSNFDQPIKTGIAIEGVELGRLSHTSIGMRRCEIKCQIPEQYDWSRFGDSSAIMTINEIINEIKEIRLPQRPRTSIVLASIEGGSSFTTAKNANLRFEVRSASAQMTQDIIKKIDKIVDEASTRSGDSVELDVIAKRYPGGVPYSHPLVKTTSTIIKKLGIEPRPGPSTSELSALIDHDIPAITLGVTNGSHVRHDNESIEIEPIYRGIAQIIGTLKAIDGGYCEQD